MVRRFPLTLLAHSVVAGLALWLTSGSFELVIRSREAVRVAMLPPVWLLPLLAVGVWLALAGLYHLMLRWRATPADTLDAFRPLFATSLLAVPYLPWLPDAVPVLRLLGGPGRLLVWIVILTQVARLLWNALPLRERDAAMPAMAAVHADTSAAAWRAPLVIALVTFAVCGAAGAGFIRSALFPGGDEPHYLVMAQSLWRDGDLKIENNHQRGDYKEYFATELPPHYLTRGRDGAIYSVHPIGMPVLMAPVYALGGYTLVAWTMIAFATGAATLLWMFVARLTGSKTVATVAWAGCCLTGPFIFNSFTVYPEIPAAFAAMLAFTLALRPARDDDGGSAREWLWRWLPCGIAAATLPWFSTKYAPMSAALILIAAGRILLRPHSGGAIGHTPPHARARGAAEHDLPRPPAGGGAQHRDHSSPLGEGAGGEGTLSSAARANGRREEWREPLLALFALGVPYALSLASWFTYFYMTWGTFSPSAPYGTQRGAGLRFLPAGGPGLLFDQEYGIVTFAPVLLLALIGLVSMLLRGGAARRLAIEVGAAFGALLATVGAFHIWWGGSATVGRPLMSGFLLLGVPLAWHYHDRRAHAGSRALTHVAMAVGLAIALTLAFAQQGLLLASGRDGVSQLLDWLSPAWSVWALGPSFITQTPLAASTVTAIWLLLSLAAVWLLLHRSRSATMPGRAANAAIFTGVAMIVAASLIVPLVARAFGSGALISGGPLPVPTVTTAQVRSALLDTYDATRRPLAIVFDPWRRVAPETVPSLVQFIARPDERRPRQPIPLLYGARWALPAGRYSVTLVFPRGHADSVQGSIALQVGRVGEPMQTWDVNVGAPGVWGRTFDLPVDANLVGFIASPDVVQAAPELRLAAESVVDAHRRLPPAETLGSTEFGGTRVYFHDDRLWLDRARPGFWTAGGSSTAVTIAPGMMWHGAMMRLQAGPVATQVRVRAGKGDERVTLAPHAVRDLPLPDADSGTPLRLTLDTGDGFVPARVEPGNKDERLLGCYVEIINPQPR